jgi:hypothetical protein
MKPPNPWQMAMWANPVNGAALRVGDQEREHAARALGDHFAVGRLDRAEYDDRLDRAYAAKTRGDLAALFRDLPTPRPGPQQMMFAPAPRRRGHRFPLLPALLLIIGLSVLLDSGWIFWIGLGAFLLLRHRGFGHRSGSPRASRGRWS